MISISAAREYKAKDVNRGEVVVIKGMAKGNLVISVEKEVKGVTQTVDASVNPRCLSLLDEDGELIEKKPKKGEKAPEGPTFEGGPRVAFLAKAGGQKVQLFPKWEAMLHCNDKDTKWKAVSGQLFFCINVLSKKLPRFTPKDLLVVMGDDKVEVWTNRAFEKHEIQLAPESSELKDRLWSHNGKAVLCKNGEKIHPEAKHLVIEGIRRSIPSEVRPFSLFFAVERKMIATKTDDKAFDDEGKDCNMRLVYADMTLKTSASLPLTPKRTFEDLVQGEELPKLPVMVNPFAIEKGQKLVCQEDVALKKVGAALSLKLAEEAKKSVKDKDDQKKAKT